MTTEADVPTWTKRYPGQPGYDPRADAPAVWMGAEYIEYGDWRGRYRDGDWILDAWGHLVDQDACPICQGAKYWVVLANPANPRQKAWEHEYMLCPRCTSFEEQLARSAQMASPVPQIANEHARTVNAQTAD